MNFWIWIILMAVVGCGIGYCAAKYKWTVWKTGGIILFVFVVSAWFLSSGGSQDFTGHPEGDAQILYERIDKAGEAKETVYNDMKSSYLKHGYGMENFHETVRIYTSYWAEVPASCE